MPKKVKKPAPLAEERGKAKTVPVTALPIKLKGDVSGGSIDDILNSLPSYSAAKPKEKKQSGKSLEDVKKEAPPGFMAVQISDSSTTQAAAVKYGMTESELRTINRLSSKYIFPGQIIFVQDSLHAKSSSSTLFPFKNQRPVEPTEDEAATTTASRGRERKKSTSSSPRKKGKQKSKAGRERRDSSSSDVHKMTSLSYTSTAPSHPRPEGLHDVPIDYLKDEVFDDQEFMNESFIRLHALFVTDGNGLIPGAVSMCPDFIEFEPDATPLVKELGTKHCSFHLDMMDLLPPRTQRNPPEFRSGRYKLRPPGAFHRVGSLSTPASSSSLKSPTPSAVGTRESAKTTDTSGRRTGTTTTTTTSSTTNSSNSEEPNILGDGEEKMKERGANKEHSGFAETRAAKIDSVSDTAQLLLLQSTGEEEAVEKEETPLDRLDSDASYVFVDEDTLDEVGKRTKSVTEPLNPKDLVLPARPQGNSLVLREASISADADGDAGRELSSYESDVLSARQKVLEGLKNGNPAQGQGTSAHEPAQDGSTQSASSRGLHKDAASSEQAEPKPPADSPVIDSADVNASVDDLSASQLQREDRQYFPYYLQLRLQLVFGETVTPNPTTTASYWLAISPKRIDLVYEFVLKHAAANIAFDWDIVKAEQDLPVSELKKMVDAAPKKMLSVPSFTAVSAIVKPDDLSEVFQSVPRLEALKNLALVYSTIEHGISLHTLYRQTAEFPGPSLLLVEDTKGYVFGAFLSDEWLVSDKFYGSGTSFLFQVKPHVAVYPWSGKNEYIMMGKKTALIVGGGGGCFGLWIDQDFNHGSSSKCQTFENECLASDAQFTVDRLEVWSFESLY